MAADVMQNVVPQSLRHKMDHLPTSNSSFFFRHRRASAVVLLLLACSDSSGPCDFQMHYVVVGSDNEQAQREELADLKADGWRCEWTGTDDTYFEAYHCELC